MNNERQSTARAEEHGGDGSHHEGPAGAASGKDRRAGFRVGDDQRIGEGAHTAWSRMAMLERRKRLWTGIRHTEHDSHPEDPTN